jgi:hypothetical protein
MPITATSSLYDVQAAHPVNSKAQRYAHFSYLQADATGEPGSTSCIVLTRGKLVIDFSKSYLIAVDGGEGLTLSCGFAAYQDADSRATVDADANAFLDAEDISNLAGATKFRFTAPSGEPPKTHFNTANGLTITTAGGNMDQNDTVKAVIAYRFE